MAIERAIVKATLFSIVQARNMFTCEVVESGGDTSDLLWQAYLDSVYSSTFLSNIHPGFVAYEAEIQRYGTEWETVSSLTEDWTGTASGDPLPNAVAYVLIGKALGVRKMGRKFFGVVPEMANAGNAVMSGIMAVLADVLLAYITPFTGIGGGTITPGIVDSAGTFHRFVGGSVSSLLGSMRRRKPGLGM